MMDAVCSGDVWGGPERTAALGHRPTQLRRYGPKLDLATLWIEPPGHLPGDKVRGRQETSPDPVPV